MDNLPKQETGPLDSGWSNVGQGNAGDGDSDGDEEEVSLAVV